MKKMDNSIISKMLLLSIMLMVWCSMSTATPMKPNTSFQHEIIPVSDIKTVILPRINNAVRSLLSEYELIAISSLPLLFGSFVLDPYLLNCVFRDALKEIPDENISEDKSYFLKKLSQIVTPTRNELMSKAEVALDALTDEALKANENGVNLFTSINKILDDLEPVERNLKEPMIDFMVTCDPKLANFYCEMLGDLLHRISYLASLKHPVHAMHFKFSVHFVADFKAAILNGSVTHVNPAEAKKLLETHFLDKMNNQSSILRKHTFLPYSDQMGKVSNLS